MGYFVSLHIVTDLLNFPSWHIIRCLLTGSRKWSDKVHQKFLIFSTVLLFFPLFVYSETSELNESFSKWVILSEEIKDNRQDRQKEKEMALLLLRQNYSVFPGFIWQNISSWLLLRWKPNSLRPTRTKVIQRTQETQSGKSS